MEKGRRTGEQNQCWCCCCLLPPGQLRDEGIDSIWSHLTFHVSQSRSWQHSGTRDLQLANILMCTGMSFNQLLSQPFPVYFSVNKVCSCEKVSLSRFLCWQKGMEQQCLSVLRAQGQDKPCTSQANPPLLTECPDPGKCRGQDSVAETAPAF